MHSTEPNYTTSKTIFHKDSNIFQTKEKFDLIFKQDSKKAKKHEVRYRYFVIRDVQNFERITSTALLVLF